jgi:hypothetical protein
MSIIIIFISRWNTLRNLEVENDFMILEKEAATRS